MGKHDAIDDSTLPPDEAVTEWLFAHLRPTADQNRFVGAWFRRAVERWGKQAAFAMTIGVPPQHLTQMFSGERAISLRHVLPLLQQRESVVEIVAPLLAAVGMTAVVRPKRSRQQGEHEIASVVRRHITLWNAVKAELADAQDVEDAFAAEPTNPGIEKKVG